MSYLLVGSKTIRGVAQLASLAPEPGQPYGLNNEGKPAAANLALRTLDDMLAERFDDDRHFVCYHVVGADGEPLARSPRMTKGVEGQVRAAGARIVMAALAVDVDLKDQFAGYKDKLPWTSLSSAQVGQIADRLIVLDKSLDRDGLPWAVRYRSRNGLRFLYRLALSVPAGAGFEQLVRRVLDAFRRAHVVPDDGCKDWTRFFRCPYVKRDDSFTWEEPWFEAPVLRDEWLVPQDQELAEPDPNAVVVTRAVTASGAVDVDYARGLVEGIGQNGKPQLTPAGKQAAKHLESVGSNSYPVLFLRSKLADEGGRHNALTRLVGDVVGHLHGFEWASPEFVLGLLVPVAQSLGGDEDWLGKAWEMTRTFWNKDAAKKEAVKQELAKAAEAKQAVVEDKKSRFLRGLRTWIPEAREMSDEDAVSVVGGEKLGVLFHQKTGHCYFLRGDGFYSPEPCGLPYLASTIKSHGMEWLVPADYEKDDGRGGVLVPRTGQMILDASGRPFARERVTVAHPGNHFTTDEEGTGVYCIVPFSLRRDLEPTFCEEVEEWLYRFVPDELVPRFLVATAFLLAIEHGPTAALALTGAPRAGKKLYVQGLAECFTGPGNPVPGNVLTARFNSPLLNNPIVSCDEGVNPRGERGDFADVFRQVVSGGPLAIERKGMEVVDVTGVHRIIITANNEDALYMLGGHRARTNEDWSALGERTVHFPVLERAAKWLDSKGGLRYTRGWIKGDDGSPSQFVIAKHFLWHFHNTLQWETVNGVRRPVQQGKRLLFEGEGDSQIITEMQDEAPAVREVCVAINDLVAIKHPRVQVRGRWVWLVVQPILEHLEKRRSRLDQGEVWDVVRNLHVPRAGKPKNHPYCLGGVVAKWKRLDAARVVDVVRLNTAACEALRVAAATPKDADEALEQ